MSLLFRLIGIILATVSFCLALVIMIPFAIIVGTWAWLKSVRDQVPT